MPEPVGALIRTFSPVAIAGQACAWAGVGASNAFANQSRTSGVKADSGIARRRYRATAPWMHDGVRATRDQPEQSVCWLPVAALPAAWPVMSSAPEGIAGAACGP